MKIANALLTIGLLCISATAHADTVLKHAPVVPPALAFVRTIDVEGTLGMTTPVNEGAQSLRVRARYLDPDVNAFVGMLTGATHFNRTLYIGDPSAPDTAGTMWNWGGDFGIVRGKHLWELDLMGVLLSAKVGPSIAIVGEHAFAQKWTFYHRTELDIFSGDTILDAEQGFYWMPRTNYGVSVGYRIFGAGHLNRNGPYLGFRLYFNNPRIPFLFPSLG